MSAHTKEQFEQFISQLKETNTTLDFYCDFENGKLPKELSEAINKDDVMEDELVNVYTHIDDLNAFLAMMRAQAPLDKAWKDLQVVLDVFADFVIYARNK